MSDTRQPRSATRSIGRRLGVIGALAATGLTLTGCDLSQWKRAGLPEPTTETGQQITHFWASSWVALLAVGVLVWGLMFWSFIVYRRGRNPQIPRQVKYNLPIEIMWTIIPLIMIAGMFYFTARDQEQIVKIADKSANTVEVIGFRWSWGFNYLNENVYETGLPAYKNEGDVTVKEGVPLTEVGIPELWLPINQPVTFELKSPDVAHSFWVTTFQYKLDVIPGRTNAFQVTPNRLGVFPGKCAELCGVDHSRMLFKVHIVTPEEYQAHINELRQKGQIGQLATGTTTDRAQKV